MLCLNDWLIEVGVETTRQDPIVDITTDSRNLDEKTWWLAYRGLTHHALDFYKGQPCAGVLYEPPYKSVPDNAIAIPNLGEKISRLAGAFYGNPSKKMRIIGVTGTDGKSSLVHFLAQSLDAAIIGTTGYGCPNNLTTSTHTTPDALNVQRILADFYQSGYQTVAMEVSSHALCQHRVAALDFSIAVFTNLSRDHLDYHPTMEDYFLAKCTLFSKPIQHAIVNIDDIYGQRLIREKRIHPQAMIWGVSSHPQEDYPAVDKLISARDIVLHARGMTFTLTLGNQQCYIKSGLLARFNVDNLLNVAACLLACGIDFAALPTILGGLQGVCGRVERIEIGEDRAAIIDYAHTAGAIESVLQGIRAHVSGKLWIVFGCGGDRDVGKRPLMAASAEKNADRLVITDDNPRTESADAIIRDILTGIADKTRVQVVQPRAQAIRHALSQLKSGDAVLITGKGHEDYQIIGQKKYPFSDQAVVRAWLKG